MSSQKATVAGNAFQSQIRLERNAILKAPDLKKIKNTSTKCFFNVFRCCSFLSTFKQPFSPVQNLHRKFPAPSSIDLNSAGQSNMQGSTQVYNDVFVSKDPQAHSIQRKKTPLQVYNQQWCLLVLGLFVVSSLLTDISFLSAFFFFFIALKVFFNFYHRGSFMCHSTDITGHSITV